MNPLNTEDIDRVDKYFVERIANDEKNINLWIRNRFIFGIGCYCGFRKNEISTLKVKDVIGDSFQVRKHNTKGKSRTRTIALNPVLRKLRDDYFSRNAKFLDPEDWLFKGKFGNTHLSNRQIDKIIRNAYKECNIDPRNRGTHTMRKTFARYALKALKNNVFDLSYLLGHSNINITTKYLRHDHEAIKSALENMDLK